MYKKIARVIASEKFEYLLLSLIIVGAFGVRLYKINNPIADWHSWRQADTASVTQTYVDRGVDLLRPRYHDISSIQTGYQNPGGLRFVEFPVFNLIHLWIYKLPLNIDFDVAGRLVSVIAACVTTLSLYFLANITVGKRAGLASSFFYAFLPFNIYFTRVVLPEALAVCLGVVSLTLFVFYIRNARKSVLFLSAVIFALALLTKPFTLFYAIPMAFLAIRKYGVIGIFKNIPLLLAVDIALIPFFLWRAWIGSGTNIVGIAHIAWAFNGDGIRFRPAFWRWIFGERLGKLILGVWGLLPFGFGFASKKHIGWFTHVFLFAMLMYVTTIATANVRHDYYQTYIIPAICLTLAQGVVSMWQSKEMHSKIAKILTVFCVGMMFGMSWYQIKDNYQINHYEIVAAGKVANEILPKDALVIAPYNGDTAFLYQTRRWGWPIVNESIEEMIDKGADYYISVNTGDADSVNFSKKFETIRSDKNLLILDLHKQKSK